MKELLLVKLGTLWCVVEYKAGTKKSLLLKWQDNFLRYIQMEPRFCFG